MGWGWGRGGFSFPLAPFSHFIAGYTMTLPSRNTRDSQNLTLLEVSGCLGQFTQNGLFSACFHSNLLHYGMTFTKECFSIWPLLLLFLIAPRMTSLIHKKRSVLSDPHIFQPVSSSLSFHIIYSDFLPICTLSMLSLFLGPLHKLVTACRKIFCWMTLQSPTYSQLWPNEW